ncbi:MAG: glycosyltransferase [Lachnospira sp.]|nr:glycosyltransferase [Lachnospira sp.]
MKVYIYRYGSLCEPDVTDALKSLGLDVKEETAEMYDKNLLPSECVKRFSPDILSGGYSFVFTINFFPWLSDVCEIGGITYISLIVDSPVLELYSNSIKNKCNRVFLFDRMLYNEFEPYNPGHIFHIPLATNVSRTDDVIAKADRATLDKYTCDISFIGSTYQEKCPFNQAKLPEYEKGYVQGLIEAQLKVYGYNFIEDVISDRFVDTFMSCMPDCYTFPDGARTNNKALVSQYYVSVKVAEQERLRLLKMLSDNFNVDFYTRSDTSSMPGINNRGFARSLDEMPIIFNRSKINLNITAKSIRSGLSLRVFDVLGCGGFLITNYQAELPEFFEIGKDLVAYDSPESLKELCAYYLAHDDERMEIARNGYEKVKKLHTYQTRLLQMIDMAFPK